MEGIGNRVEAVVEQVPVGVECHRGGGVPQHSLDGFDVRVGVDHEPGCGVSPVVGYDTWELGALVLCASGCGGESSVLGVRQSEASSSTVTCAVIGVTYLQWAIDASMNDRYAAASPRDRNLRRAACCSGLGTGSRQRRSICGCFPSATTVRWVLRVFSTRFRIAILE